MAGAPRQAGLGFDADVYPMRHTLAYSDLLLLMGLSYSGFRLIGLNMFSAYQATLLFFSVIGFAGMSVLLRRGFGCRPVIAALGGFLFIVNVDLYYQSGHPQLFSVMLLPWFFFAALRFVEPRSAPSAHRAIAGTGAILLLGGMMLTSFYMTWGAGFITLILLLIHAFRLKRSRSWSRVRSELLVSFASCGRWNWMFAVLAAGILAFFLWMYVPVVLQFGGRRYRGLFHTLPTVFQLADVTRDNWLWGGLAKLLLPGAVVDLLSSGNAGVPPILLCCFLGTFFYWRIRSAPGHANPDQGSPRARSGLWVTGLWLSVCIAWLLMLRFGSVSLWILVFNLVPGANGLRDLGGCNWC